MAIVPGKKLTALTFETVTQDSDVLYMVRGSQDVAITYGNFKSEVLGSVLTIAGKDSSALVQAPTVTEDGYAITWDNTAGEYNLTAVADGTKIAGQNTDALVQSPTATEDGYVIAWNNSNNEYELIAGGSGGSILSNNAQTLTADKTHTFNNSFKVAFNQQGDFGNNEMLAFNANATGVGTVAKLRFNGASKSLDIGIGGTAHTSRAGVGFIEASDVLLTKADFNYVQSLFSRVEHSDDGLNFSIVNMGGEWDLDPNTGRDQAYFGGLRLPYGTTANRPSKSPVDGLTALTAAELEGMIRYNSTTKKIEGYELAGGWQDMIGGDGIYGGSGSLSGATTVTMGGNKITWSGGDNEFFGNVGINVVLPSPTTPRLYVVGSPGQAPLRIDSSGVLNALTVDFNGNVRVNGSSGLANLHVNGTGRFESQLYVRTAGGTSFRVDNTTRPYALHVTELALVGIEESNPAAKLHVYGNGVDTFRVDTSGILNNFLIDSSGRIGIIQSAPTADLHLPAGDTINAPLRIPHGVAPTAPNDGDIWTTTVGLFVRINGVTVGPLT